MTGSRLEKHHGWGNDFLIAVVDELPDDTAASAWAGALCHRTRGVGADGLIFATPDPVVMRLWNSDGSTAEVSGNGLRCLAHAIARRRGARSLELNVSTPAGRRRCIVRPGPTVDGPDTADTADTADTDAPADAGAGAATVVVDMGAVSVGGAGLRTTPGAPDPASTVEAATGVVVERWSTADAGNPHAVLLVSDPAAVPVNVAGPAVEALFPDGTNVHFVADAAEIVGGPGSERRRIAMRTWERGAGITEACGTGAVAAAAVLRSWGRTGNDLTVRMPGGDALVSLMPRATLTGPSVHVATVLVGSFWVEAWADSVRARSGPGG